MATNKAKAADFGEFVGTLGDIERRCREHAVGLPQEVEVRDVWSGVMFSVGGLEMTTPLADVSEILNFPPVLTRVPGAKPWVLGVANIRGNLLPIVDLQIFLGGEPTVRGRRSRVLVLNHDGVFAGLLVGEFVGMRTFLEENRTHSVEVEGLAGEFIESAFEDEGRIMGVFSMRSLARSTNFLAAAA